MAWWCAFAARDDINVAGEINMATLYLCLKSSDDKRGAKETIYQNNFSNFTRNMLFIRPE